MEYLSLLLLLISIGSMSIHKRLSSDDFLGYLAFNMIEDSTSGNLLLLLIFLTSLTLITSLISSILSIKWYWGALITIIVIRIYLGILASLYYPIILASLKKLKTGSNPFLINSFVTFILGLVLFFVSTL